MAHVRDIQEVETSFIIIKILYKNKFVEEAKAIPYSSWQKMSLKNRAKKIVKSHEASKLQFKIEALFVIRKWITAVNLKDNLLLTYTIAN